MIITTGSDEKTQRLHQLGANDVVNYRTTGSWPERVRELTDDRGVDHVIETVGRLEPSVRALAMAGEIAFVGLLDRDLGLPAIDPQTLWTKNLTLRAIVAGSREQFEAMNAAIKTSQLRPVIDRVFAFNAAAAAYNYYQREQPLGKVVIKTDD